MLNDKQRELVVEYRGLVSYVLRKYITIHSSRWEYALEDLYQVGYEGLCIAAENYEPDKGVSYWHFAEIVVRNHLYQYCRSINRSLESVCLEAATEIQGEDGSMDAVIVSSIVSSLDLHKKRYNKTVHRGIEAMWLRSIGYSAQEIKQYYQVPENHIRAWIAKARKVLQQELQIGQAG